MAGEAFEPPPSSTLIIIFLFLMLSSETSPDIEDDGLSLNKTPSVSETFTNSDSDTIYVQCPSSEQKPSDKENLLASLKDEYLFLYRTKEVLEELVAIGVIPFSDLDQLNLEELKRVRQRAELFRKIRSDGNLSMIFGRAERKGIVTNSSIGTWSDQEIERIREIVKNFIDGNGSLYRALSL